MIVLGAVLPHPPVLLPSVGNGRERQAQATLDAYRSIAARLRAFSVRRLLMISTHGIVTLNRFHLLRADFSGDLSRFDAPAARFRHAIDLELSDAIIDASRSAGIPLTPTDRWETSDHSIGVPLTLLGDAVPDRIGVVSISFRPPQEHLRFGRVIGEALGGLPGVAAIIASGDAVHTLSDASAYGHHRRAAEVQAQYESALLDWDAEQLCEIDESLRREVDESVVSPTLILMGALQGLTARPHMLASEHPWGVGYVTSLIEIIREPPRGRQEY